MPTFSRTLPDLVDSMNLYKTGMMRCIENNKIYDAIQLMLLMNEQLDDSNRVIFSTHLSQLPRADRDAVHCPQCGEDFEPKPNLAIVLDSGQPMRQCRKCSEVIDYLANAKFVRGVYNIMESQPILDSYWKVRRHRELLYSWFNKASKFVEAAFRNYRLNYKGGGTGKE